MTGKKSQKKHKNSTENNLIKLNLGCGVDYKEGYVNIDNNKKVKADSYRDFINLGLPYKDSTVDEVYCKNLFEHIPNPLEFLLEIKRVLKKTGKAIIITSNASYILYHFPRKKAYHDTYNLTSHPNDKHYFMFQKGHLMAFTTKAKMNLIKLDYYISNSFPGRDRTAQLVLGKLIGKKFGYSDFLWILEK